MIGGQHGQSQTQEARQQRQDARSEGIHPVAHACKPHQKDSPSQPDPVRIKQATRRHPYGFACSSTATPNESLIEPWPFLTLRNPAIRGDCKPISVFLLNTFNSSSLSICRTYDVLHDGFKASSDA
jgi:hypothetical protein